MNLILQDIRSVKPKIIKHFKRCPNASVSAMFRVLRKSPALSFFGDYPIIAFILEIIDEVGIKIKRPRLLRAIRQSPELRGQKLLINSFLSNEIAIRKKTQVVQKTLFDPNAIQLSSDAKIAYV